jgi:polyisoprenyl-teichoic acid--peptidoglycan teichoic acid transferase
MKPPGEPQRSSSKKFLFAGFFLLLVLIFIGTAAVIVVKGAHVLTVQGAGDFPLGPYKDFSIEKEDSRIDVLLLGIRGAGDPDGGLLADTMILISYDTNSKKAAVVSIPRDLYVELPDTGKRIKLNAAYAFGEERVYGGGGLALSKQMISYITGVYVDHALSIDFNGFRKAIDIVGGVSITRSTPFREGQQWMFEGKEDNDYWYIETNEETLEQKWVFTVPAGTNLLSGEDALYYARSRFSSSDFDRMARQQEIITSFIRKVLSLGVLANPVRIADLMDTLSAYVRTDADVTEMKIAIDILRDGVWGAAPRYVLDTTNFLVSGHEDSQYVLLTKTGTFDDLRTFFRTLLEEKSQ